MGSWIKSHPTETVLFFLGCALRLTLLGAKSMWADETLTLIVSRANFRQGLTLLVSLEGSPPFYYLLMHFWIPLFGDPLFAIRFFSVLCGIACLPVFYLLCLRLLPKMDSLALLLGCISSFWIHFSQDGRLYSLFLLLALLESYFLLRLRDEPTGRFFLAYGFCGILGLYTHYFFGLLLLTNFFYLLPGFMSDRRRLGPWVALYGALSLLYLPWLGSMRAQMEHIASAGYSKSVLDFNEITEIFSHFLADASYLGILLGGWLRGVAALALALLSAGLYSSLKAFEAKKNKALAFCAVHLLLPFALVVTAQGLFGRGVVQPRYLGFLSPFFYILAAQLVERLRGASRRLIEIGLMAVMVAGTVAYFTSNVYVDSHLQWLSSRIAESSDSRTIVVYREPYYFLPMRYYYMPQRPQYYIFGKDDILDRWSAYPGYPGLISRRELAHRGKCFLVDPSRQIIGRTYWLTSCKQLSDLLDKAL